MLNLTPRQLPRQETMKSILLFPYSIFLRRFIFLYLAMATSGCGGNETPAQGTYLPPNTRLLIALTGDDYYWNIRYAGPDQRLFTADDITGLRDLYLPEETKIHLQLHSLDYIYTFAVDELDLNQIAVPEMEFTLDFQSGKTDTFAIRSQQLCGFGHESLKRRIFVEPGPSFANRLQQMRILNAARYDNNAEDL